MRTAPGDVTPAPVEPAPVQPPPAEPPTTRRTRSSLSVTGRSMGRLFLCILIGCFSGCAGYTLGPTPPTFMKGVRAVAVPIFKNTTITPDVEAIATNTVIKQIQEDGTFEVTGVDQLRCSSRRNNLFDRPSQEPVTSGERACLRRIYFAGYYRFPD